MSTERCSDWGTLGRFLALASLMFAVSRTRAADVDFRPVLSFGVFHEGNVAIIGDTSTGDDAAAVSLELPVERRTESSRLAFMYQPTYVAYKQSSDLNYLGQQARFSFVLNPSRTASYSFDVDGSRTDRQGVRDTNPETAVTFVPRSTQTDVTAFIRGDHTGRRNIVGWELRGSLDNFSAPSPSGRTTDTPCLVNADCDDGNRCTIDACVAGVCQYTPDVNNPQCVLQDSVGVGGRISWRYEMTERSSIGLGVDGQVFTFDSLPSASVESLGIVGAHTFSRSTRMTYILGAAYAESEGESDTEAIGDVNVNRNVSESSTLVAGARRWISQGSGIGGVSLDEGGYLAYAYTPHRRGINGSITAGYWKRDPLSFAASADTVPSTDTLSANATFGWNFNQYLSLSAAYAYSDQSSSVETLNTQYGTYGVYLRWSIRGDVRRTERGKQGTQQTPQGGEKPQP